MLLYGRGATAIAREVEKAGVPCTVEKAKESVDKFMAQFPLIKELIDKTHKQVVDRGWVENIWGRREYFYNVGIRDSSQIEARQKRQAFNFLIQGYVGELLRKALINLQQFRREHPSVPYKLLLTVHDNILVSAPLKWVPYVADHVIPECMVHQAKAPKLGFTVAVDTDVSKRLDVPLYVEELIDYGFDEEFAKRYAKKDGEGNPLYLKDKK